MRHRLQIRVLVRSADTGGGNARADTAGPEIWARVETVSAYEANIYQQRQQIVTHRAMIRFRSDLSQGQSIVWQRPAAAGGDLPLYVTSVADADPDGRPGEFLEVMLREGGNL